MSYRQFYRIIFCVILSWFLITPFKKVRAQEFNYKVNAMYIYYFAKYINWTDVSTSETLTIGILGDSPVEEQLKSIITGKKVYGKSIVIRKIDLNEVTSCNMVVISKSEVSLTTKVNEIIQKLPILIITEKSGYTKKGAQICIYVDDEDGFKTKFELSKSNIEKSKFKVSHELLALGEILN